MNTAQNYFVETVKPTVDEFLNDPFSVRRARLAAIVLYHLVDYVQLQWPGSSIGSISDKIVVRCPDFLLIRDVCNASKHSLLTKKTKQPRQLDSASQVLANSYDGLFHAPFGYGHFAEASYVWVQLNDGSWRNFVDVVRCVSIFFDQFDFSSELK